jgi:hypothetical protein
VHRTPVGAPIIISQVHYLNYSTETVPVNYMYSEFFCKRMSFSHERELRVIFQELPLIPDPNATNGQQITDYDKVPLPGKALEINLDRLIDKIYISPLAPEWFINVTTEILKKCGLDKEVISSTMDDNILY